MDYHQNQLGELHLGPSSKQDDKKVNYSSALCYSEKTFLIRILSEKQTAAELFMIMNHFGIFSSILPTSAFLTKYYVQVFHLRLLLIGKKPEWILDSVRIFN